ncbi:MAG TPA: hypothetical protein HPQ00_12885, partial [Magnetococcales bacterium]|nr:hypothetical protein [Magnetococcales bacterium]
WASAGLFDDILKEAARGQVPANQNPGFPQNQSIIPTGPVPARHIIVSVPDTRSFGLGKQTDQWSCGAHVAARLARFYGRNVTYQQAMMDRLAIGIPTMEKLSRFDPSANMIFKSAAAAYGQDSLVKFFGSSAEEEKMLLSRQFGGVNLKEMATFDDLKTILAQNKPVAVMITNGIRQEPMLDKLLKKEVKLNYYHWVLVFGYDDSSRSIHYADSYADQHQVISYDDFQNRWNTRERGFFLNIGTGMFVSERTMVWVDG